MSSIKSKEDAAYVVNNDDLIPLVNNTGDVPQSVTPGQLVAAANLEGMFTVGPNGYFATIAAALTHIGTLALWDVIDVSTMTVDLVRSSDLVVTSDDVGLYDLRGGDIMHVGSGDGTGQFGGLEPQEHWYPIQSANGQPELGGAPGRYKRLNLFRGIIGPSQSGFTAVFYRPRKYTIILSPGEHDGTGAVCPDGAHIVITGNRGASHVTTERIEVPWYGYLELDNVYGAGCSILTENNQDAGFGQSNNTSHITAKNIRFSGRGNSLQFNCAAFIGRDVLMDNSTDHPTIPSCDYMDIDGWVVNHGEPTEGTVHNLPYYGAGTKHRHFTNIKLRRVDMPVETSRAAASLFTIRSVALDASLNVTDYVFNITNGFFYDAQANVDVGRDPYVLEIVGPTSGSVKIIGQISDCVLEIESGGTTLGHVFASGLAELTLKNVKTLSGGTPTVSVSGGAIVRNLDHDSQLPIAYSATISIDAGHARKWVVGQLTGDTTIAAPANPFAGYRLSFLFEQNVTGSQSITWNAVFNVHSNPLGGSNEKAIYEFEFDGSNWVQVSTVGWA